MTEYPKKHHFVPQFLLRRFAGPGEKLIVHRIADERRYTSTVTNLGHRNFGHSLYLPDQDPDHVTMEAAMANVEGEAATAVQQLSVGRQRAVPLDVRHAIAWFLALQWQRSRFFLHVVAKELRELEAEEGVRSSDVEIQTSALRNLDMLVMRPWLLRNEPTMHPEDRWNYVVSVLLSDNRHWSCYRPRNGGLLIGDNMFCFSGIGDSPVPNLPPALFDHGVGAGLHQFRRFTVPLGDKLALIISLDPNEASRLAVSEINRFTVFNSREFVAHAPSWQDDHPGLSSELRELLYIQRLISPAFLQDYAPGRRQEP